MAVVEHARPGGSAFAAVLGSQPFGISTGFIESDRGNWPRLVRAGRATSTAAIELSALSWDELPGLVTFLEQAGSLGFAHLTVHAPAKGRGVWTEWDLARLVWPFANQLAGLVVHPDAVEDWLPLRALGELVLIENMDARKPQGTTVEMLDEIFDRRVPAARFCLDIAHAASVDPSMGLADALVSRFVDRLVQVHISSLDARYSHVPLTDEDESRFADVLFRCRDVPWILEAPLRLPSSPGSHHNCS